MTALWVALRIVANPISNVFQLSTLISVWFGYRYFSERHIRRRLLGAAIMVVGAVVIAMLGRGDR